MIQSFIILIISSLWQIHTGDTLKVYASASNNKRVVLEDQSNLQTNGKPFTLSFESPKNQSLTIQLHATFNEDIYNSYLEDRDLTKLDAWQPGSTMSISIVTLVGNDNTLRIREDAVQGYMHDNNSFTSFAKIDSTESTLIVSKEFSVFQDLSETYFSKEKKLKIKKAEGKTIYCIIKYSGKYGDIEDKVEVPFTIET
jgi:hypothetical protein